MAIQLFLFIKKGVVTMIRGTTAPFTFELPCKPEDIVAIAIEFWQEGNKGTPTAKLPIIKKMGDCALSESSNGTTLVSVQLLSTETVRFSDKIKGMTQLSARINDPNSRIIASQPQSFTVYPMRNDLIIDDPTEGAPVEDEWAILDGGKIMP
jgi:hypothetical protein